MVRIAEVAARVVLDTGAGSFNADDRFQLTSSGDDREVWETGGYADAADRLELTVDQGAGSIRIERP